jgi:sugar O-acyltransferase (sialic acid O-acetyltransferase NeuD family)
VRLLVIGAGGHAKVVIDTARCAGFEIAGVIGRPGGRSEILGIPVSGSSDGIEADAFIVAFGDNRARAAMFAEQAAGPLPAATVVHPSAVIADGVSIGDGTFVAAGVVVNVDAHIGRDAILNTGCTVDHDVVVGDHALVGPASSLCGESRLGQGVTFGAGASIIPTKIVGDWSIVGAGAAVVGDLPAHSVCVGVPARPTRRIEG